MTDVVCAMTPDPFHAVGRWYQDFSQTTDEEVRALLAQQNSRDESQAAEDSGDAALIEALRGAAYPLACHARDYDPLMARIAEARLALLG